MTFFLDIFSLKLSHLYDIFLSNLRGLEKGWYKQMRDSPHDAYTLLMARLYHTQNEQMLYDRKGHNRILSMFWIDLGYQ
jgi:hypothetical protein